MCSTTTLLTTIASEHGRRNQVLTRNRDNNYLKLCHRIETQWLQGCRRFSTTIMDNKYLNRFQ